MAGNPIVTVRLRPVIIAYLDELADLGFHGKGRAGVIRRFVENGIARAAEKGVIAKRSAKDFGEAPEDEEED